MSINHKRIIGLIATLIMLVGIPLIVFLSQKRQETRQHAGGQDTQLYFVDDSDTNTQLTSTSVGIGVQKTYDLYLDTLGNTINGFDVSVDVSSLLSHATIGSAIEGADASKFNTEIFKTLSGGTFRFAKVTTDTQALITGKLQLAKITFTTTSAGSGTVGISSATITSPTSTTALSVSMPSVNYTISTAPITPTACLTPPECPAPQVGCHYINQTSCSCGIVECTTQQTPTPTLTPIPSPTNSPTPIPTSTPVPTATPIPTVTLAPTPTFVPGGTQLVFTVTLQGLGTSNSTLIHRQKNLEVKLIDSHGNEVATHNGPLTFDNVLKNWVGTVDIGHTAAGFYTVKIKTDNYLRKQLSTVVHVTDGSSIPVAPITLLTGDANNDNVIDIQDYNFLMNCYGQKQFADNCASPFAADFNDDGKIDGVDYNLFIRSLSSVSGQ